MSTLDTGLALACASNQSIFLAGDSGPVWRLVEGVVRLDRATGPLCQPVQLALPGDLVGSEALCGQPYQYCARAFTPCRLEPLPHGVDGPSGPLLQQALLQQIERSQDMAQLRTGSVMQRLTHMLALLGMGWRTDQPPASLQADAIRRALPTLREVALLVDAKTETVCRALAQLLPPRKRRPGGVSMVSGRLVGGWSPHTSPASGMA